MINVFQLNNFSALSNEKNIKINELCSISNANLGKIYELGTEQLCYKSFILSM